MYIYVDHVIPEYHVLYDKINLRNKILAQADGVDYNIFKPTNNVLQLNTYSGKSKFNALR